MSVLLIKNVKIPLKLNYLTDGAIVIKEGLISEIKKNASLASYDKIIDGKGRIAVPGGIDIHAHVHDPDYTHHEDFNTGSTAAAYGGLTAFFDMPLRMYVEDLESLKVKVKAGEGQSHINFGIIAGMLNEGNLHNVKILRENGVKAFKLFTCEPFRPEKDATLVEAIKSVDSVEGLTMIHAEDDSLINYLVAKFKREGRHDPLAHHESRPSEGEASAIRRVAAIAEYLNARIHIVHVSSAMGAEEVRHAKERGVKITAETCPHYLHFTRKDVEKWGNYLKMNPALKTSSDVAALWKALAGGVIDAVTSDHAPSPENEKEVDVWEAWGGIPGLETMLPLLFTKGVKELGILTLERFIEVTSSNPARIMGVYPKKGALIPGADADIVLMDPGDCKEVKASILHHKVNWTPYEGLRLCGWASTVIVNGEVLIEEGVFNDRVKGKFLAI